MSLGGSRRFVVQYPQSSYWTNAPCRRPPLFWLRPKKRHRPQRHKCCEVQRLQSLVPAGWHPSASWQKDLFE